MMLKKKNMIMKDMGEYDPHIWLDPINAKVILNEITEHLIENDSKNASTYKSNLAKALS